MNLPSRADPPFACPPDPMIGGVVLDLPAPISVNRIWRKTKSGVIKSPAYRTWVKRADEMLLQTGQFRGVRTIMGKFIALIVVKRSNLDLDNNSKSVLDYLQSRRFIIDDKLCEELTLRWGHAPSGCRVTVTPIGVQSVKDVLQRLEAAQ